VQTGVAEIGAYMDDLEEELELSRKLYVTAAVTEIATLRAELFGAQTAEPLTVVSDRREYWVDSQPGRC
jgi:hypothetical protein